MTDSDEQQGHQTLASLLFLYLQAKIQSALPKGIMWVNWQYSVDTYAGGLNTINATAPEYSVKLWRLVSSLWRAVVNALVGERGCLGGYTHTPDPLQRSEPELSLPKIAVVLRTKQRVRVSRITMATACLVILHKRSAAKKGAA